MNHQRIRLLPALRPRRTLRLLCLLVPSRTGDARSVPVLVLRAQPPRMDIRVIGRRVCPSASCCGKSRPGRRAPRCWRVAYGCGEPFDREP